MTEELKVVLRRSEHTGFGFSLLGTTGPPHVIFDIIENSPAADCGAVEAGDVILKVNETDVHRYTTKEVLKCLRLSDDLITLELKRDPKLKARIKEQLAKTKSPHYVDIESQNIYDYKGQISPTNSQSDSLNSSSSLRYKSPTNLPPRQTSANHSRSSSASSAKIQTSDVNTGTGTGAGIASTGTTSTSPSTCRPSRIPTALKNPQKNVIQHSPQHKRPRPSQIPTKASIAAGAATAAAANGNTNTNSILSQHSEHSNSKSNDVGGCVGTSNKCEQRDEYQIRQRHQQQQQHEEENNREPLSAPPQPKKAPRFEAYMMTGDLILNLSRTPQSSNLIAAQAKKVDSLRDSPNRSAARANGALAPRASGESSPTSSSSVESPTHSESSDSVNLLKKSKDKSISRNQKLQQQQQQQRNSINNSLSNNSSDRQCRKDSLTNDTLLLCEELDRDEEERDIEEEEDLVNDEYDNDDDVQSGGNYVKQEDYRDNKQQQQQQQQYHQRQQQRYHRQQQQQQRSYELYEADEEDQTNYDITNIVTYNSSDAGYYVGIGTSGNASGINSGEQQPCLVMHTNNDDDDDDDGVDNDVDDDDDDDDGDDDNYEQKNEDDNLSACVSMSSNSLASAASTKQKLRELKHKQKQQQHKHKQTITTTPTTRAADTVSVCANSSPSSDLVDYARETLRTTTTQQNLYSKQHHHRQHHQLYHNHQHHHHHHHHSSSSSSGGTIKSDGTSQDETSFSVPTSPISLSTPLLDKNTANSVPTSPEPSNIIGGGAVGSNNGAVTVTATGTDSVVRRHNGVVRKCDSAGFRTSKSEDHLQQVQREGIAAVIPIDIDEDVNSSLNTLLDTRQDSEDSQASNRDRIVWTYNAPLTPQQLYQQQQQQQHQQQQQQHPYYGRSSPNSHSSSISSSSPHHSDSPASPTSVSSSVMSSSGSKGALGITCTGASGATGASSNSTNQQQQQLQAAQANAMGLLQCPINGGGGGGQYGDQSVSEAISNISSPDYQDDDNLLSSRDLVGMVLSDPSDSDSTILVSDAVHGRTKKSNQHMQKQNEHKLVIQVRGFDNSNSNSPRSVYSELKDSEDELATLTEEPPTLTTTSTSTMTVIASAVGNAVGNNSGNNSAANNDNPRDGRDSSPPVSDDGSDVESLHSYHYSPKAVDMPSAIRLAKRLYSLDGFKKSDVSRHLSKNNDFSRAVADEYLKYFNFEKKTLDQSLREFLQQFSLSGETQERERVLVHFSKRFLDCNPGSFNSQDAVHTLTCAIMLLNTDLHGQNIGRKMSCAEFVDNLAELNDGENFPKDILKYLYQAIKSQPLEWALDEESAELQKQRTEVNMAGSHVGQNPFLDIPESSAAVEFKKGYVMRKSCYEANYKKTPFGKRSWKMFYCTLRDLVLFLHKDEHGFRKSQMSDNLHNAIRIHHALATKATDYTKKQHVFRLQTADQAEYLFQTSDSKELQSWVETINFVCAAYSAPPLEGGVGSQKRFQRPLLPSTHTKFLMKEQLDSHEQQVALLENTLSEHKKGPIPSKGLPLQNFKEKESYLQYELRRYKSYVSILNAKMLADQQIELQMSADEEASDTFVIVGTNAAQRSAQVIVAATAVTNQTQLNNNAASGQQQQQQQQQQQLIQQQQQQQQSTNRKKEKRK